MSAQEWKPGDKAYIEVEIDCPAGLEPMWSVLSTDREKPTDAYVNGVPGRYWRDADGDLNTLLPDGDNLSCLGNVDIPGEIKSVTLLHTYNPETHVPVERALIARLLNLPGESDSLQFRDELASVRACFAALADGAQS